jgi:hypothetical protein
MDLSRGSEAPVLRVVQWATGAVIRTFLDLPTIVGRHALR